MLFQKLPELDEALLVLVAACVNARCLELKSVGAARHVASQAYKQRAEALGAQLPSEFAAPL